MNELQIRLTADIQGLQSALAKAKQTLKSFESETATDSEKSNVGFRRKIGIIEQLTAKAKQLKVSLAQATNEQQISSYNAELEQTNIELARLNALGKSFANTSTQSFDKFRVSAGAASGSAIAFNRVIQDAPFGIIGVGNNIQQLAEQFSALRITTGSTGAAVSTFFKSLFTGSNLLVLGISAATSAFTAYQLGLFDSKEETEDLKTESELLNESLNTLTSNLSDLDSARLKGNKNAADELVKFKLLKQTIEDVNKPNNERIKAFETLKKLYPEIIGSMTSENAIAGQLSNAYNKINDSIRDRAKAQGIYEVLVEIERETAELQLVTIKQSLFKNKLLEDEARLKKDVADFTELVNRNNARGNTSQSAFNESLRKAQTELAAVQAELSLLNTIVAPGTTKALNENEFAASQLEDQFSKTTSAVDIFIEKSKELKDVPLRTQELIPNIKLDRPDITGLGVNLPEIDIKGNQGFIEELQKRIQAITLLRDASRDLGEIANFNIQLEALQQQLGQLNGDQVSENINLIVDSFSSLGAGIAASLNIGDRALRGFVTTLLSATPKIIAAIILQAQARNKAAEMANIANAQQATGNAIVVATEGAKGLGPVGLALLPVFIAGAVALISSAFGKAGGGGGSASAGQGSTFTNRREFGGPVSKGRAYIVGEKRPELFVPNTNGIIIPQLPSMDYSGASMAAGAMAVDVNIRGVSYGDDILFTVQQAQIRRGIR